MEKRNASASEHELMTAQVKLGQSEVGARDLRARYEHIRASMNVTLALKKLDSIENYGFQGLLAQLVDNGVIIGADAVLPRKLARRHERFGLTLVIPGTAPLIWLNLLKHDNAADLVDTVVHEAIHSTVRIFGRHSQTPEPGEAIASLGEEIVALAGANLVLRKIAFSARRVIAQNTIAIANCKAVLRRLGCSEQFLCERLMEAEPAAAFFTDFGLDFACTILREGKPRG